MWKVAVSLQLLLLLLLSPHCPGDRGMNETVIEDIWNAFRAVTNDSALLGHLIPEMYGPSIMHNANPKFVFKMPTSVRNSYHLMIMQRSDFAEPIFPNITRSPAVVIEPQQTLLVKSGPVQSGEWQQLGLDGWTGELQPAMAWQEHSHKDVSRVRTTSNPREQIQLDLNGQVTDIRLVPSSQQEGNAIPEELMNGQNVFIARANDPFGYSMSWPLNKDNDRGKRDVAKLYSMIKCSTGCDPLIYKGYGCYCGFGGRGVATDGIDRCCRQHDKCYEQANCISYLEYFVPYVWKCYRGKPLCALDHGEWGGPDSCAARLCQCDLRLSRCLRKFYCPTRRAICYSSRARRLQNLLFFD